MSSTLPSAQAGWVEYADALGTSVDYPQDIFSRQQGQEGGGPVYVSRMDARAYMFSR
jgi:hypothetical protein